MWRHPNIRRATTLALLLALLAAPAALWAQIKPHRLEIGQKPESILWVGNSFFYYNDSMHNHVYATLYRKSPEGLKYTAGLSPELVGTLQTAAWEAVRDYFKQ